MKKDQNNPRNFKRSNPKTEREFRRALDSLIKNIEAYLKKGKEANKNVFEIQAELNAFALKDVTPWAEGIVDRMYKNTYSSNQKQWDTLGVKLKNGLEKELKRLDSPLAQMKKEAVNRIVSIPQTAAQGIVNQAYNMERVEERLVTNPTLKNINTSDTYTYIQSNGKEVTYSGKYVAKRIAVTEYFNANNAIMRAQAQDVGIEQFISRATMDKDECKYCRELNGKIGDYSKGIMYRGQYSFPPYHPQCKCFAEPVI